MPKLKRASSSLLSSQAKKCKKKQREDPVKWQQQRERDRLRYQADSSRHVHPCSEETDNSRRLRDTAACRQVRLENPEGDYWNKKGIRLHVGKFDLRIPTEGLKNKLEILQPIEFQGKIPIYEDKSSNETYCSTEWLNLILNIMHKNGRTTIHDVIRYEMVDKLTLGL